MGNLWCSFLISLYLASVLLKSPLRKHMNPKVCLLFLAFACSQLPSSGALVFFDLSSVPAYQNQSTPAPTPPGSGVNVSSKAVSISGIAAGAGTYSLDLTISDSLGSSGLVEKAVRLDSRLNDVELIYTAARPSTPPPWLSATR